MAKSKEDQTAIALKDTLEPIIKQKMEAIQLEMQKKISSVRVEVRKQLELISRKLEEQTKEISKRIDSYESTLNSVKTVAENSEETLLNVLLAIRQNEYLQAWYPAQKGHSEMKVVGKHPAAGK